jgi:aldehyde dehydrogenase (NAD+)
MTPDRDDIPRFHNFINGAWVPSTSGELFSNENPADTSQILSYHAKSTVEDVDRAVAAAKAAFPAWKATPAPVRARLLARACRIVHDRIDELARGMTLEEGKTLNEARGEILKGLNLLEYYVGEGSRLGGETLPSEMVKTFTYTVRQPLGVVAVITPWNFPWAIPCWKSAPALIAGNTVVFKPATWTPLTAARMVEIFHEAGFPPGVFNLITGGGGTIGDHLVNHPDVKVISFTGSTEIGRRLHEMAAKNLKKVTCEMGGKNPVIVLDDADLDLAAEGIVQGAFGSTGQRCTATSRVVVTRGVKDALVGKILEKMSAIKVGPGIESGVTMGACVSRSQLMTDLQAIEEGQQAGARLLAGGRRLTGGAYDRGWFIEPALFDGVTADMKLNTEEIFGPVLAVLEARDFDHALELANSVRFGLSSSLYARDIGSIMRYIDESEVGMVHVNSPTVGGEAQLPFGGIKESGVGDREMGHWGIEFFTELKTVFLDYTGKKRQTNIY